MPSVIELHDSVVQSYTNHDDDIIIRFSPAFLHRGQGPAGYDTGDVFTLDLDVKLHNATVNIPFTDIPTELQEGSIAIDGITFDNCIPYPLDVVARVTAKFIDYYGHDIHISAKGVSLEAVSEESYLESFPGTDV